MLSEKQRKRALENIRKEGMTVTGWARKHNFPMGSVRNLLYRGMTSGPSVERIAVQVIRDGLV